MKNPSSELLQAIAVTAELTGATFTEPAVKALVSDLMEYSEQQVFAALRRCRRELTHPLRVGDILSRIDDGRPTPEIAWSQVCQLTERDTFVGTAEQIKAFCSVSAMIDQGDTIPARMAFLEAYRAAVAQAKDAGEPVMYLVSAGFDVDQRDSAVRQAHAQGLLTDELALPHIRGLLPNAQKLLDRVRTDQPSAARDEALGTFRRLTG